MWVVGSVAAVVGLIVVVAALVLDPARERPRPTSQLGPGLPRPSEIRRLRLPATSWGGYAPDAVDAELAELAERYEALYLAAGPSVIAEAERRLAGGGRPGAESDEAVASAEELEDGRGDGTGVLDR